MFFFLFFFFFKFVFTTPDRVEVRDGRIYGFYYYPYRNYRSSQYMCEHDFVSTTDAQHGQLAFVLDDDTQNYIHGIMGTYYYWVGYDRYEHANSRWFHLVLKVNGFSYNGIDTQKYNWGYRHWGGGQPSDSGDGEWCACVQGNTGYWDDKHDSEGHSFVCMEYFECDGKVEFLTASCTENRGYCSTGNKCQCEGNYGPDSYCIYCKNHFDLSTSCTICDWGYDVNTDCASCMQGSEYHFSPGCQTCINERFVIDRNVRPAVTSCRDCLWGHDLDDLCRSCEKPQLNFDNKCLTCLNGNYLMSNITDLSGIYSGTPFVCNDCNKGWDMDTLCTSCLNENYDINNNCLSCRTHYLYEEEIINPDDTCTICYNDGWDILQDCDECINDGIDPNVDCLKCKNYRLSVKDGDIFNICVGCKGNMERNDSICTECLPGYVGYYCQFNVEEFKESCYHGSIQFEMFNGSIITDEETAFFDSLNIKKMECSCEEGYTGIYCNQRCSKDDLMYCFNKMDKIETCTPFLIRDGSISSFGNLNLDGREIIETNKDEEFGNCDSKTGCFIGLNAMTALASDDDYLYSLRFVVKRENDIHTYEKTCVGFSISNSAEGMYTLNFDPSKCYGDEEILTSDIEKLIGIPFSSSHPDYDFSMNENLNCSIKYGPGWIYDCSNEEDTQINPFGDWGEEVYGFQVSNMTLINYFEMSVCKYEVKEKCIPFVRNKEGTKFQGKSLEHYKIGFGDCYNEDCFRGLDYLHSLSKDSMYGMSMKYNLSYKNTIHDIKMSFWLDNEESGYQINYLKRLESDSNNGVKISDLDIFRHSGEQFSSSDSCPTNNAGWWYKSFCESNTYRGILPTGLIGLDSYKGAYYTTLTHGESVDFFNIDVCGSITSSDKLTNNKERIEFEGDFCQDIIINQEGSDFVRTWEEYKNGFGEIEIGEFFLGLDSIHSLSGKNPRLLLSIEMAVSDQIFSMVCFNSYVAGEEENYAISFGNCKGSYELERWIVQASNGKPFQTIDHSSGESPHIALETKSGWWYGTELSEISPSLSPENCAYSNLNPTGRIDNSTISTEHSCIPGVTGKSMKIRYSKVKMCGISSPVYDYLSSKAKCFPILTRGMNTAEGEVISFDRTLEEYENGFGRCGVDHYFGHNADEYATDCFIGFNNLRILSNTPQFIEINFGYNNLTHPGVHCGTFQIDEKELGYKLNSFHCVQVLDNMTLMGIESDFSEHAGKYFQTYDIDPVRDGKERGPVTYGGPNWYRSSNPVEDVGAISSFLFFSENDKIRVFSITEEDPVQWLEIQMCMTRISTKKLFSDSKKVRSCSDYCDRYDGKSFKLSTGEQLIGFSDNAYLGDFTKTFTGPYTGIFNSTDFTSFFSKTLTYPLLFSYRNFEFDEGIDYVIMEARESCTALDSCGWDIDYNIRSVYVPEGYRITFFNEEVGSFTEDNDMYQIGGTDDVIDLDINMEIKSFVVETSTDLVDYTDPIFFEYPNYCGRKVRLVYDCRSDCSNIQGFRSIYVPTGYVVDLYSENEFGGIRRRFVGPISVPRIDGYFEKNTVASYKSDLSEIESVTVEILEYYLDSVLTTQDDEEMEVNEIVVRNPTSVMRSATLEGSYTKAKKTTYEYESFKEDTTNEDVSIISTSSIDTSEIVDYDVDTTSDITSSSTLATSAGGADVDVVISVDYDFGDLKSNSEEETSKVSSDTYGNEVKENTVYSVNSSETETSETNTFTYICNAMPFTLTTCTAMQKKYITNIPYLAVQKITYTNGDVVETIFEGELEEIATSQVYYSINEEEINYCSKDFTGYLGDCFLSITRVEENAISEIVAAQMPESDIEYIPIDFKYAKKACYFYQGSHIAAPEDSIGSYFFGTKMCAKEYPILLGIEYKPESELFFFQNGKNYTLETLPFHNFGYRVELPEVDSYVFLESTGNWKFYPVSDNPKSLCVVCKKKVGQQIFLSYPTSTDVSIISPDQ